MQTPEIQVFTPLEADELALALPRERRLPEPFLMRSRWWDYRLMHPVVATYLFASWYVSHIREWTRRHIDEGRAEEYQHAWTGAPDLFDSRDLICMWKGRQTADALGCPYDFVMQFALDRAFKQMFRHPLRPNQLYSEEFVIDLSAAWKAEQSLKLRTAELPALKAPWTDVPKELATQYKTWLVERINARPAPRYRLLARLLLQRDLDEQAVESHWSDEARQTFEYLRLLQSDAVSQP